MNFYIVKSEVKDSRNTALCINTTESTTKKDPTRADSKAATRASLK